MHASRAPRVLVLVLVAFALSLTGGLVPRAAVAAAEAPLPDTMVSVGDSITQAASSAGSLGADAPQNSWSTGTSTTVNSHYLRLLAAGAPISGRNYNRSVSGARVADLEGQMLAAAALEPDYLTVLIGGNDLCTDTVGEMPLPATFEGEFQAAMVALAQESPETHVFVSSIPDVYDLWQLFKGNWWARFIWSTAEICQSLLANPTSTQASDEQRRQTVRQRNIDYNEAMEGVCAQFDRCQFDGNAVFDTPFTSNDVSGDYFHPSVAGQAKLASVTWAATFDFVAAPPPPPENQQPVAGFSVSCDDLACAFTDTSTDDAPLSTRTWDFGDDTGSAATNPSHTYATAGTYIVTLTVTDAGGLQDSESHAVTVTAATAAAMTATFAGSSEITRKNTWTATVTIAVSDTDGRDVQGANVTGTWSTGATVSCTTNLDGECSVSSGNLNMRKVASATLTIDDITHATLLYDDGGNPVQVVVTRP
jgi:PKD repeat protein